MLLFFAYEPQANKGRRAKRCNRNRHRYALHIPLGAATVSSKVATGRGNDRTRQSRPALSHYSAKTSATTSGLALDLKGGSMFITGLADSVYSANLDGSNKKTLLVGKSHAQQATVLAAEAHA